MVTIVDTGLEYQAKLLNGVSVAPMKYMAIGSGTTAEATGQTALVTEMSGDGASRQEATCSYEATGNKSTWVATFTNAGATDWTINEYGIFDASSGGHMYARHVFSTPETVAPGNGIQITLKNPTSRGT